MDTPATVARMGRHRAKPDPEAVLLSPALQRSLTQPNEQSERQRSPDRVMQARVFPVGQTGLVITGVSITHRSMSGHYLGLLSTLSGMSPQAVPPECFYKIHSWTRFSAGH